MGRYLFLCQILVFVLSFHSCKTSSDDSHMNSGENTTGEGDPKKALFKALQEVTNIRMMKTITIGVTECTSSFVANRVVHNCRWTDSGGTIFNVAGVKAEKLFKALASNGVKAIREGTEGGKVVITKATCSLSGSSTYTCEVKLFQPEL